MDLAPAQTGQLHRLIDAALDRVTEADYEMTRTVDELRHGIDHLAATYDLGELGTRVDRARAARSAAYEKAPRARAGPGRRPVRRQQEPHPNPDRDPRPDAAQVLRELLRRREITVSCVTRARVRAELLRGHLSFTERATRLTSTFTIITID